MTDDDFIAPPMTDAERLDGLDPDWDHVDPALMRLDGEFVMFDGVPTVIAVSPELAGGHAHRLASGLFDDLDDDSPTQPADGL